LKIGVRRGSAKNGSAIGHGVEHLCLEFLAVNPSEALKGVQRQERYSAGWAAENSLWITCIEIVSHHPEQKIFSKGFIFRVCFKIVLSVDLRASNRQWHLSAVILVASCNDSPVGNLKRFGAIRASRARMKAGNSRDIFFLMTDGNLLPAPSFVIHSFSSSKVIFVYS